MVKYIWCSLERAINNCLYNFDTNIVPYAEENTLFIRINWCKKIQQCLGGKI